jgi:hypothetical protein
MSALDLGALAFNAGLLALALVGLVRWGRWSDP